MTIFVVENFIYFYQYKVAAIISRIRWVLSVEVEVPGVLFQGPSKPLSLLDQYHTFHLVKSIYYAEPERMPQACNI